MIKTYRDIVGVPVHLSDTGQMVALVNDVIVNPATGKLEAVWVKALTEHVMGDGVLRLEDILSWGNKIMISSENVVAQPDEILAVEDILRQEVLFIGNQVENEMGERLGEVYGAEFNLKTGYLKAIYTCKHALFLKWNKRIFAYDSILEARPEKIIVKDNQVIKEEQSDMEPTAAA